ncbi:MAG TPA: hypothetical protein VNK94_07755 [Gaiellaceae bacterium]|nr:hypothetical protein [Gaiellaceae bacterium]
MNVAQSLLLEIARCPVMETCLETRHEGHPCATVVQHQWAGIPYEERRRRWRAEHHVPEPWVGHLERAPLLFLSSNPSLSVTRPVQAPQPAPPESLPNAGTLERDHPAVRRGLQAPRAAWSDAELIDRYSAAFDVWMADGVRQIVDSDGTVGRVVPFWRAVKRLAHGLLDRPVVPGADYALTEIVHCKSRNEIGVASAAAECVPRYLRRVLALSPATVVVVLGSRARHAVRTELGYPNAGVVSAPIDIEGRTRLLILLAHPAARGASRYPKRLADADLVRVRGWLRQQQQSRKFTWEADDVRLTKPPFRTTSSRSRLPG